MLGFWYFILWFEGLGLKKFGVRIHVRDRVSVCVRYSVRVYFFFFRFWVLGLRIVGLKSMVQFLMFRFRFFGVKVSC